MLSLMALGMHGVSVFIACGLHAIAFVYETVKSMCLKKSW